MNELETIEALEKLIEHIENNNMQHLYNKFFSTEDSEYEIDTLTINNEELRKENEELKEEISKLKDIIEEINTISNI